MIAYRENEKKKLKGRRDRGTRMKTNEKKAKAERGLVEFPRRSSEQHPREKENKSHGRNKNEFSRWKRKRKIRKRRDTGSEI